MAAPTRPMTAPAGARWIAATLAARRGETVARWLAAARAQPCHAGRPDADIADHLPLLFDALVALLGRRAGGRAAPAPLDDPAVLAQAQGHARARFEQGLAAAAIAAEFRLLRREIGRALRLGLAAGAPPAAALLHAELLVHDALDGAAVLALAAFDGHEAERRRLAALAEAERAGRERLAGALLVARTAAHELNNALMPVVGGAELLALRARGAGDPALAAAASQVQAAAEQVAEKVDQLQGLVRLEPAIFVLGGERPVLDLERSAAPAA